MRHADRRAGLEHRPDGADGRRLARDRVRHDGGPAVRLVHADELQRRGSGVVGPAGRRHLGGRRDDVARADEGEPARQRQSRTDLKTPDQRRTLRSKTFSGIAKAMAEQWTKPFTNLENLQSALAF